MKKTIVTSILGCLFCAMMGVAVFARSIPDERLLPRLVDEADLLTDAQEEDLLETLDEISERQEFDVVVVTVNSLNGKTPMAYADDFYDYNGYGYGTDADGALLLISMEERDWYISTTGFGITAITDAGREYMADQIVSQLGDGDYEEAFHTYASLCDDYVTQAKTGQAYDTGHLPKEKPPAVPLLLLGAAVAGFLAAFIPVGVMRYKMRSVRRQVAASGYVTEGSHQVNESKDQFLYHTVTKHAIPKNNGGSSSHIGSSGRSHGGGGGKF